MNKSTLAVLALVACFSWPAWAGGNGKAGRVSADKALDAALQRADVPAARAALKAGANPNATIWSGTALTRAVVSNSPALVELILKAGADPDLCPRDTWCPFKALHVGYGSPRPNEEANREAIAALLLRAGANPDGSPNDDMSPLHRAIQQGRPRIAMRLLDAGANPQGRAPKGAPLDAALRRGELALARRLVAAGAELGPDPVLLAAIAENGDAQGLDIALGQMRKSARTSKLDLSGALAAATRKDCVECVRLLAAAGARYRLHAAVSVGVSTTWFELIGGAGADVLALYAALGLDPRAADADGTTLLHFAARSGKADSVKWLVSRGVPVDARETRTRHTPLMVAAENGNARAVEALLGAGADPALLDAWGKTAKVLAAQGDRRTAAHEAVVRLLQDRGASEYTGTRLPASAFDNELAGKAQDDVTGGFYEHMPFLEPGLRFFTAYVPLAPLNMTPDTRPGPEATMYVVLADRKVVKLARPADLLSLGIRLRSEDDALRLMRFFTYPGYAHHARFRIRFESLGYWEVPETDTCITVSGWKGSRKPSVARVATDGGANYVVRRYMIPEALMKDGKATVDEIVRTTETVREDGAYSLKTTMLPMPGLSVRPGCFPR